MATKESYGQQPLTILDRAGAHLSVLAVRRNVELKQKRVADIGCGYNARTVRSMLDEVDSAVLVDVSLADDLKAHPKVHAIEGLLPDALAGLESGSLDVVLALAILEHLNEPERTLSEIYRVLAPGGTAVINVPSWLGKPVLEFVAFRMGISTDSMNDHKTYYDPRDLWPMLVRVGFRPQAIRCRKHKLGFATLAVVTKDVT